MKDKSLRTLVTILVFMFIFFVGFSKNLAAMCCDPGVVPNEEQHNNIRRQMFVVDVANGEEGRLANAVCCYRAPDYMNLLEDWKFDTKFQFFVLGSGAIGAIYYAVQKNPPWENLQFGLSVVGAVYGLKLLWSALSKTPCVRSCCRP